MQADAPRGGGKQATVGLEDFSGAMGVTFLHDGAPSLLADDMAIRFRQKSWTSGPWAQLEGGLFRGRFALPADGVYVLEESENLVDWQTVPGVPVESGNFAVEPASALHRFFRARRVE